MPSFRHPRMFVINNPFAPRLAPELAAEIGLNESILLLQLEFWLSFDGESKNGCIWIRKTTRELRKEFPFLSLGTIHRTLTSLVKSGYLEIGDFDERAGKGSAWYTLNTVALNTLKSIRVDVPNLNNGGGSDCSRLEQKPDQNGTTVLSLKKTRERETLARAKRSLSDPTKVVKTKCPSPEPTGQMHAWAEEQGYSSEVTEEATAQWYRRRRAKGEYHTEEEWFYDWQAWTTLYMKNEKQKPETQEDGRPWWMAGAK